jgi:hypothetical protein
VCCGVVTGHAGGSRPDAIEKDGVHWISPSLYMQIGPQARDPGCSDGRDEALGLGYVPERGVLAQLRHVCQITFGNSRGFALGTLDGYPNVNAACGV